MESDIKPTSIMLIKSDYTKIADFGVAQLTENTTETDIIGTPSHISPEQLTGEHVGYVLYELLVERQAFHGDNSFSIMYGIANGEQESMSNIRIGIPVILGEILKQEFCSGTCEANIGLANLLFLEVF